MGSMTRAMMAGLFGFGLLAALPMTAEARGDAGQSAQPQRSAAPAARPSASRSQAQAPARRATSTQQASRQEATRQQASLPGRRAATEARSQNARQRALAAVPYENRRQAGMSATNLRQSAMLTCTTRNGRRSCAPQARNTSHRWTGGLAPAAMSQSSCPDGTIATMALGHNNVVRCVPL